MKPSSKLVEKPEKKGGQKAALSVVDEPSLDEV
jgi:hypothetical protein